MWKVTPPSAQRAALVTELGVHPLTAQLLINRGLSEATAHAFLHPSLSDLPNPFLLPDMERGVERIVRALREKESIAIYGDYDVDGIAATATLGSFLKETGATPRLFLPRRDLDGYGLSTRGIDVLAKEGIALIITVDNGTSAHEAIAHARQLGLDVIVTDHHAIASPPPAYAFINPQRADAPEAFRVLCGSGVAFFLCMALRKKLRDVQMLPVHEPHLGELLDLVALGTIADIVPLTGINRILAHAGFEIVKRQRRIGLRALMEIAKLSAGEISSSTIGFRLAPRLNAAGRLADPALALQLLTAEHYDEAMNLARELNQLNAERQALQEKIFQEAVAQIDAAEAMGALVVFHPEWHIGVLGIVAAKLVEHYGCPAIVLCQDGSGAAKGSARSIPGVNIVECLKECEHLLIRAGGHAQAAGLTLDPENIKVLYEQFSSISLEKIKNLKQRTVQLEAIVAPNDLSEQLFDELASLEPFGPGNPEPLLGLCAVLPYDLRAIGDAHLSFRIRDGERSLTAIAFGMAGSFPRDVMVDIAFVPEWHQWNSKRSMRLRVKEVQCTNS